MIIGVLYRALAASAVTRARAAGVAVVGCVGILIAWAVASSEPFDPARSAVSLVNGYGLNLVIPIAALVIGTAALGDPIEDGTYVYLWLRPIARWKITVAAFLVTVTAVIPFAVLPTVVSAAVLDADPALILDVTVTTLLAAAAYSAIFVLIGHLSVRGLVWGIGYLLIFEQFIARGGSVLGFFSIHSHVVSVLSGRTGVELPLDYYRVGTSTVVLVVATLWFLVLSAMRQSSMEVA